MDEALVEFQRYRPGNPRDPYKRPAKPHHIHVEVSCTDHRDCPAEHWEGGRPEPSHPHHVECNVMTGRWAYTRLTSEEIADLKFLEAFVEEEREKAEAQIQLRLGVIREKAKTDRGFAALAEHLGIPLQT
jgi:hypothetical protein